MAGVPRYHQSVGPPILYGRENDPQPDWYVVNFDHNGLLISQPHWRLRNGAWSGGGPFFCEHLKVRHIGRKRLPRFRIWGDEKGPITLIGTGDPLVYRPPGTPGIHSVPTTSVDVAEDLLTGLQAQWYTPGILKTRPGRPEAGLGQFLAELKDLPKIPLKDTGLWGALRNTPSQGIVPRIKNDLSKFLNASANELLNWEFGWRPFLADFRAFHKLSEALNGRLADLVRDQGKRLRRGARLSHTHNVETLANQHVNIPLYDVGGAAVTGGAGGKSHRVITRVSETKVWFVAGYQYYIPNPRSWLWKGKAVAALYGALPTPELLYNITPWTWLADWWTDVGDLAALASPTAVDALTTLYAFTMRYRSIMTSYETTTHMDGFNHPNHSWDELPQCTFRSTYHETYLERGHGWAPFGTGLPGDPLTERQGQILAALATSRVTPDARPLKGRRLQ